MGKLFDEHVRLFEGLVYERVAYGRRPGCDPELISHGLEPVTEIEARGMGKLSDVDAELLTHKLTTIVEEARDVYQALSISEAIMVGDMNCGIFTASGDPAMVDTGIYFHTMLNNSQLKYANKYYRPDPSVGLADGDIFFFNDELGGGGAPVRHVHGDAGVLEGRAGGVGELRWAPGGQRFADAGGLQREGEDPV